MIRIGVVNIDVSHPKAWATIMTEDDRARYTAVYNDGFRNDDEVEAFMRSFGVETRYQSVEEMAQNVDVVFVQACNWDKHLDYARRVLDAGKPVFIDKPIVGSVADCRKLERLSDEGHTIIGSSSARYAREIEEFLAGPESERGTIMHVYGTSGVDEFNYGIHIVEAIGGLLGAGAVETRYAGSSQIESMRAETYHVSFGDTTGATYTTFEGLWMPFHLVLVTSTGTYHIEIDTKGIYRAMLDRIFDFLETGTDRIARIRELTESVRIMLAGRLSREKDGNPVRLDSIPDDDPGFDGYEFEKAYAAKAKKIYLS